MTTFTVADLRDHLAYVLQCVRASKTPVAIVRWGKPVAKIVPIEEDERSKRPKLAQMRRSNSSNAKRTIC